MCSGSWRARLSMNLPHQVGAVPAPAHVRERSCRGDLTQRRGGGGTQRVETLTDRRWTLASLHLGVSALVPRARDTRIRSLRAVARTCPHILGSRPPCASAIRRSKPSMNRRHSNFEIRHSAFLTSWFPNLFATLLLLGGTLSGAAQSISQSFPLRA